MSRPNRLTVHRSQSSTSVSTGGEEVKPEEIPDRAITYGGVPFVPPARRLPENTVVPRLIGNIGNSDGFQAHVANHHQTITELNTTRARAELLNNRMTVIRPALRRLIAQSAFISGLVDVLALGNRADPARIEETARRAISMIRTDIVAAIQATDTMLDNAIEQLIPIIRVDHPHAQAARANDLASVYDDEEEPDARLSSLAQAWLDGQQSNM